MHSKWFIRIIVGCPFSILRIPTINIVEVIWVLSNYFNRKSFGIKVAIVGISKAHTLSIVVVYRDKVTQPQPGRGSSLNPNVPAASQWRGGFQREPRDVDAVEVGEVRGHEAALAGSNDRDEVRLSRVYMVVGNALEVPEGIALFARKLEAECRHSRPYSETRLCE